MTIPSHLHRPLPKPEVSNVEAFGALVEMWSNGDEPIPTTLAKFKERLTTEGITLKLPPGMEKFMIVKAPVDTVVLMVPDTKSITNCRDYLENDLPEIEVYPISTYYKDAFKCDTDPQHGLAHKEMTSNQRQVFMTKRIGEYSMNICM